MKNVDLQKIIYMNTARQITLQTVSVNRPGLILSGFDDYFARSRVQVLGNAEMYFPAQRLVVGNTL